MKRLCSLLFCLLFILLPGCGGPKPYRINYDLDADPRNLDPQTAADRAGLIVISNVCEGLFTVDSDGALQNAVALSHEISSDGKTYTFTLDPEAKWRYVEKNGEVTALPVTAADFVFAFRRLLDPSTRSPAAVRFFSIRNAAQVNSGEETPETLGVYADGEYSLRIELEHSDANFLNLLATTYAIPCNQAFFEETMGKYGLNAQNIMVNGPFQISSWSKESGVRLKKNELYRDAESVLPAGVNLQIPSSASNKTEGESSQESEKAGDSALSRLEEGLVDAAFVDGKNIAALRSKGFTAEPVENSVWGICLSLNHPVLENSDLRQAIAFALDRASYAGLLPENLSVASALVPHGITVQGENYRTLAGEELAPSFDAQSAFQHYKAGLSILDREGYGEISLLINQDADVDSAAYFSPVSQRLQKEISLFFKLEPLSANDFESRVGAGDFDAALLRLTSDDNSPWPILERFQSGSSRNVTGYENFEFDEALSEALSAETPETAAEAYRRAESFLLEDAVFLPLYYGTDYFVTQPGVSGIDYNRQTGLVCFSRAKRT